MAIGSDPHVLVVAGSDSSGGAGIARDIETLAGFGLRTCLAVTAVTVQTHNSVEHIEHVAPDIIAAQMRAALDANEVRAIKIGMLGTTAVAEAVGSVLVKHTSIPVVLDPVLVATSGRALMARDAVETFKRVLLPLCRLVSPNLPELAFLVGGHQAGDEQEILRQAKTLLEAGARAVLVKGGHALGDHSTDFLVHPDWEPIRFEAPRLSGSVRGTGCVLASAIAAHLAIGASLEESVWRAKRLVFEQIRRTV
ncbi:bifunctional hydroxymethylpyrimidine kinase/phosphomethylpyrimidine kinase [Bradyrhizobium sp. LA6.7]|uniref:bifunctional hydroxymethylpyrimidine kinase/phosphomethylpyrimidine kinase n=1 Tax=unclassified Bradyrhizobium TaxID=2631580 RepID=UPI003390DB12